MTRPPRLLALLGVTLIATPLLVACSSSAGSCAAPDVSITPSTVEAGGQVEIDVDRLMSDCNDTGSGRDAPATGVSVTLAYSDGTTEPIGTLSAGEDFAAAATFTIPADSPAGQARLLVDGAQAVGLEIRQP